MAAPMQTKRRPWSWARHASFSKGSSESCDLDEIHCDSDQPSSAPNKSRTTLGSRLSLQPEEISNSHLNLSRRPGTLIVDECSPKPADQEDMEFCENNIDSSPSSKSLRMPSRIMSASKLSTVGEGLRTMGKMAASISKKRVNTLLGEEIIDNLPFLKKYNLDATHKLMGQNIAHLAAQHGDTVALVGMQGLPGCNILLEKKDCIGWTPLHYACAGLHYEAMDIVGPYAHSLVDCSDQKWMIHLAAREGTLDVLQRFSAYGWTLDVANPHGERTMDVVRKNIRPQVGAMIRAQNEKPAPRSPRKAVPTSLRLIAKHFGVNLDD